MGVVIYWAFCLDVAQGRMDRAPNENRTHSWRLASLACWPLHRSRCHNGNSFPLFLGLKTRKKNKFKFVRERKFRILVWRGNLIRHLISPNQDDLSYSSRDFFTGSSKLGKLPNPFSLAGERRPVQTSHWPFFNSNTLYLDNAAQCRRLTGGSSSSSMDTRGNLSNLWIPRKESQLNIN